MSKLDHMFKPEATETVHRLEVITGTGRRRQFSGEFKAGVVEETLAPDAVVSEIARRHGLSPQQLFAWRRQARSPVPPSGTDQGTSSFVPALMIDGVTVRVGRGADAKTIAAVLRALKAGP